jgi:hypothetical protein
MRRRAVALLAALSILAAAPAIGVSASASPAIHKACVHATILGKSKCIAKGQYCTHTSAANHDYHKYGYHCGKRDSNGRYHLRYS